MMKLYSSLSRQVEDFTPLKDNITRIYSCGPTVYDHVHIGNLAAFINADTLRRSATIAGYETRHIMNITDIDDKTVDRSKKNYPNLASEEALTKLTREYEQIFISDMEAVGNDVGNLSFIRAVESIGKIQKLIKALHEKGFAYLAEDGIYFSISAYKNSGKKYGQLVDITENSTSQARIDNDEYDKESPHDFALWKKQKPGEPAWNFEIDGQNIKGRPGWHIECSAMSTAELGQPFDIHTGGIDLKFPHHENEIAQSTATAVSSTYANFFVHNEHILVDGKKMSKSANNYYTLQDVVKKGFDPLAFRLLILQSHYRSQAHFSWENLEAAQNRLETFRQAADMAWQSGSGHNINYLQTEIKDALINDLATPRALALISGVFDEITTHGIGAGESKNFIDFLKFADTALGLNLASTKDIDSQQKELINEREKAREHKDWAKSDELRDKLKEQGIGLNDTSSGAIWWRIYNPKN